MDLIDNQSSRVLAKALDGLFERNKAIASNVANAETPGYKAKKVKFEGALQAALTDGSQSPSRMKMASTMRKTNGLHFGVNPLQAQDLNHFEPEVSEVSESARPDGNSVDIEREMADLARNTGRFTAVSKFESRYFNALRGVIKGGA